LNEISFFKTILVAGSAWLDRNSDNRANSAQFQLKLPTGAELGKIKNIEREIDGQCFSQVQQGQCEAESNKLTSQDPERVMKCTSHHIFHEVHVIEC
jgi:hypothetical protein